MYKKFSLSFKSINRTNFKENLTRNNLSEITSWDFVPKKHGLLSFNRRDRCLQTLFLLFMCKKLNRGMFCYKNQNLNVLLVGT